MRIEVKQEHIDNGRRFQAFHCALALAFTEAGFVRAACDSCAILHGSELRARIKLPQYAIDWVQAFDRGDEVKPFTIEIQESK